MNPYSLTVQGTPDFFTAQGTGEMPQSPGDGAKMQEEARMTNKEYQWTLSNEQLWDYMLWVVTVKSRQYINSRDGIVRWLDEEYSAEWLNSKNGCVEIDGGDAE